MNIMDLAQMGRQLNTGSAPEDVQNASRLYKSLVDSARMSLLDNLTVGSQIRGTVLSDKAGELLLKLENGMTLGAKAEGVPIQPGQMLNFEVKGNDQGQLSLTPLQANLSSDSSLLKALDIAGLPVNERTIAMTDEMMKQGLSIAPSSLKEMMTSVNLLDNAKADSIVQMKQLGLPITSGMYDSFEGLKNQTGQLLDSYEDIANNLTTTLRELSSDGEYEKLGKLFSKIVIASEDIENTPPAPEEEASGMKEDKAYVHPDISADGSLQNPEKNPAGIEPKNLAATMPEGDVAVDSRLEAFFKLAKEVDDPKEEADRDPQKASLINESGDLASSLEKIKNKVLTDKKDGPEFDRELGKDIAKLLEDKDFGREMGKIISKKLLLSPQELSEEGSVKRLYERVLNQIKEFSQALSDAQKEDTSAGNSLQRLRQNVDFLNELNQNFAYIQLPLKMSEGKNQGDLYVYTNKKSLAREDGSVTAMLHLGMDHLGDMDIYVALRDSKVSTRFYLESDEIIDFLEEHMDQLDSRLQGKGYSLQANLFPMDKKEDKSPFDAMLGDAVSLSGIRQSTLLSHQSFNALA